MHARLAGVSGRHLPPGVLGAGTGQGAEDAIEAVAAEYARRLARRTGMLVHPVPVSHSPRKRALYRLVFATRSPYGLWVFGDTVARARATWGPNSRHSRSKDQELLSFDVPTPAGLPHLSAGRPAQH